MDNVSARFSLIRKYKFFTIKNLHVMELMNNLSSRFSLIQKYKFFLSIIHA